MEAKAKRNAIVEFFKGIFQKLSESALFSVLGTNTSSTIGDEYLEDDNSFKAYKKQAAEEAGYSANQLKSIEEAFLTSGENIQILEEQTNQVPKTKGKFELEDEELTPDPTAEVIERPAEPKARTSKNDDNELSL